MATRAQGVGRPRDAEIETAVLSAARELLAEVGYEGVTMDDTAARAGTSKAAIYRRFSSKAEMLFAAVLHGADIEPPGDTGTLDGDLLALATQIRAQLSSPEARAVASNIIAEINRSPEVSHRLRETSTTVERAVIAAILERAVGRREVDRMPSPETVHRLIGGGLIATALAFGEHLDDDALAEMVTVVAAGLTSVSRRPQPASRARSTETARRAPVTGTELQHEPFDVDDQHPFQLGLGAARVNETSECTGSMSQVPMTYPGMIWSIREVIANSDGDRGDGFSAPG